MSRPILIYPPDRNQATTCGPPVPWQQPPTNTVVPTPVSASVIPSVLVPAIILVPSTVSLVPTSGTFYPHAVPSAYSIVPADNQISADPNHPSQHRNPDPNPRPSPRPSPNNTEEERGRSTTPRDHTTSGDTENRTRSGSEPGPGSGSRNTSPPVRQSEPQLGEDLLATQALRDLYKANPTLHGQIWKCIAARLAKPGVLRARVVVDGLGCPSLYTPAGDFGREVVRALEPYIKDDVIMKIGKAKYQENRDAILDLACIAYRTVGIEAILRGREARRRKLEESTKESEA
ncbi:hypothetical protein F5Y13DRAFT_191678 [Hypoxylon sp. FL1857]|nr:hypothetical protein F5Y13DRAFT_191678 [Hypoxylon sp. FL1857]